MRVHMHTLGGPGWAHALWAGRHSPGLLGSPCSRIPLPPPRGPPPATGVKPVLGWFAFSRAPCPGHRQRLPIGLLPLRVPEQTRGPSAHPCCHGIPALAHLHTLTTAPETRHCPLTAPSEPSRVQGRGRGRRSRPRWTHKRLLRLRRRWWGCFQKETEPPLLVGFGDNHSSRLRREKLLFLPPQMPSESSTGSGEAARDGRLSRGGWAQGSAASVQRARRRMPQPQAEAPSGHRHSYLGFLAAPRDAAVPRRLSFRARLLAWPFSTPASCPPGSGNGRKPGQASPCFRGLLVLCSPPRPRMAAGSGGRRGPGRRVPGRQGWRGTGRPRSDRKSRAPGTAIWGPRGRAVPGETLRPSRRS
ncbi:uncharacterized protein LOC116587950 [Mustela erminea]|uniref:uncharacterized protein LOC116587950 n=1 Tax=Mustela erminea TaxID=36723 RepID=UPI0013866676|nr:uncharacterized protein LOC116587950 [Mustela erminea]